MEIKNLWEARDQHMPQYELDLKRLEDNGEISWRFGGRDTSDNYGEHVVHVRRKDLKDLHDAIEHELYPERYFPPKNLPPENKLWEEKLENCLVCHSPLKPSRYKEDTYFCPQLHGKVYPVEVEGKKFYRWYSLVGISEG